MFFKGLSEAKNCLRSSSVPLRKGVLKICSKLTGEHPCLSAISTKLQSNFIEIALRHGCPPVNFFRIFRTPFLKNTSGWLLLLLINEIFSTAINLPSWLLIVQSQQWKQNNVSNMFKINIKETETPSNMSVLLTLNICNTLFWCFHLTLK